MIFRVIHFMRRVVSNLKILLLISIFSIELNLHPILLKIDCTISQNDVYNKDVIAIYTF